MNLISCNSCGVVLDKNKLKFDADAENTPDNFAWDGDKFVPIVECPVCKEGIVLHSGN